MKIVRRVILAVGSLAALALAGGAHWRAVAQRQPKLKNLTAPVGGVSSFVQFGLLGWSIPSEVTARIERTPVRACESTKRNAADRPRLALS